MDTETDGNSFPPPPSPSINSFRALVFVLLRYSHSNSFSASIPAPAAGFVKEMSDIDKQIAWHYAQIALLKAKRNAIAPIRRLPNELMIRILTIVAVESDTLFDLRWTKLMYVCRHWHGLALAAQPLWAFVDIQWRGGLERLYGQLDRSGAAPLTLKMDLDKSTPYYLEIILEHSERIRELQLGGESQQVYKLIGRLTSYKFPILSSLSLDASRHLDQLQEDIVRDIPEAILCGGLPSLRELKLDSIGFPWTSLSGLTILALTSCLDSSATSARTFHGLLDMLSSCPQLQTLRLEITIPPPLPDQLYATVELSALAWLFLRERVVSCEMLLNHLRIPPTAAIQLLPLGVRAGVDIRALLVPIRRQMRTIGTRTPVMFKISRPTALYCTMTVCVDTAPRTFIDYDSPDCPFSLDCRPRTETTLREILRKVLKAVPSESITHLEGRDGFEVRSVTWRAAIELLPSLDTIYLQLNPGGTNCINALLDIETRDPEHERFPLVRRLHIRLVRLEREIEPIVTFLNALEEFLQKCRANGNSLGALEFDDRFYMLGGTGQCFGASFPDGGRSCLEWESI
ncbi:F-box domain-containing protein [Mycena sanguinolenta]|uniref:F-box domain-containing protein n=1 Tax=Mycena sanguinolenta TaxID=230812 RepID=A0A8H6YGW1_9AGAR|nr:F-box domain-containing protein [Mycena sanguinolenta]